MNINLCQFVGRLTADPELKSLQDGTPVCNFSIATNKVWKNKAGEKQEKVTFVNCVAWRGTGETIAQYCKKGHEIYVQGSMENRTWEKQDGSKGYATDINVDRFEFGAKPKGSSDGEQIAADENGPIESSKPAPVKTDDIPF